MNQHNRKPKAFVDIADFDEDTRINTIGRTVMERRLVVGFVTDDEPGKAERYISKLVERFPGIRVVGRSLGPVEGSVTVRVGPPEQSTN